MRVFLGGCLPIVLLLAFSAGGCNPRVPRASSAPPAAADENSDVLAATTSIRLKRPDAAGNLASFEAESPEVQKLPENQAHRAEGAVVEVRGLPQKTLASLEAADLDPAQCARHLALYVESSSNQEQPIPLLGTYRVESGVLCFEPRFPLEPGLTYRVEAAGKNAAIARFEIPEFKPTATTRLEQVFPTAELLPENQLKFYLHFSGPMSRGQAYQHVRLLNSAGEVVEGAFLELTEELWNPASERFTLFFEPGRIKRGLRPREELGPILEENKSYTLVVDAGWLDAEGNPLAETHRKQFRVGPPDDEQPNAKTWKIEPPAQGQPLTVTFPEPLDEALLERIVWVEDADGQRVEGQARISDQETRWTFRPASPWIPGKYSLAAETTLEDLAGNSLASKFEVDLFEKVERQTLAEVVRIPFEIPDAAGAVNAE